MEVKKDDIYYYYFSSIVTFRVEDTLFRIPRKEFAEESEVFANMFSLPSGSAGEGDSDEVPIRLEGVSASDFRCFLQALIPRPALYITKPLTDHDLEMALKLAKMWCFDGLQKILIKDLEDLQLPASRKLQLARLYDIKGWYKPELRTLALRSRSLTLEEVEQLGPDMTAIVSSLRDQRLQVILREGVTVEKMRRVTGSEIEASSSNQIKSIIDKRLVKLSQDRGWN